MKELLNRYKDGVYVTVLDMNYLAIDAVKTNLVNENKSVSDVLVAYSNKNTADKKIKIVPNYMVLFKEIYPNGFYVYNEKSKTGLVKYSLFSIDNNDYLKDDGNKKLKFSERVIKDIARAVSVKRSEQVGIDNARANGLLVIKVINKVYKGSKLTAYQIQDEQGNTKAVTPDDLKNAIRENKVYCVNAKLTPDNKLRVN